MLLDSFSATGLGAFKKRWTVNVGELRGIVAVVGANGAGKSSFLEMALPGALYRQCPTRGSLVDLAVDRNACLDVTLVNGARWTFRHLIDSVSKKSEALLLRNGEPVPELQSAKVRDFDDYVAGHFLPPEVLFSTMFGAQGAGGFLAAKRTERTQILLRVLGVERLERLAEQARERLKVAKALAETTAARLADERARGGDADVFERNLTAERAKAQAATDALVAARAALDAAREEARAIEAQQAENAALDAQYKANRAKRAEKATALADQEERLKNNRDVLAEADSIRGAVASLEAARAELVTRETEEREAEAAARAALLPWLDVNERRAAAQGRADRARAKLRDKPAIEQARDALPALLDELAIAEGEVLRLNAEISELQNVRLAGAGERIAGLLAVVGVGIELADEKAAHEDISAVLSNGRDLDAAAVLEAQQTPLRAAELQSRLPQARDRQAVAQRQVADAQRLAGRAAELAGADTDLAAAEQELAAIESGYAAAGVEAKAKRLRVQELQAPLASLRADIARHEPVAQKLKRLEAAETRIAELEPVVAALRAELEALDVEAGPLTARHATKPMPDLGAHRRAVAEQESVIMAVERSAGSFERLIEQAKASTARQAELELQHREQLAEVADWMRIAADLGKDGLQALEIDAAGPELTALTNDILHRAHGPRFTLRVETQRASADGKRMLEGCDVVVLDTVQGREAAGETFSGGERVILAEALSLAILVLACRRAGLTDMTLVRDESGAALDPANARVYVAMLRHAVELVGARHCLLVSHMPEVQELCDHRIEVGA